MKEKKVREEIIIPPRPQEVKVRELVQYLHTVGVKVEVQLMYLNSDGSRDFTSERNYTIMGKDYESLLAPNPVWAPNKPEGTFRAEDLLKIINHRGIK